MLEKWHGSGRGLTFRLGYCLLGSALEEYLEMLISIKYRNEGAQKPVVRDLKQLPSSCQDLY